MNWRDILGRDVDWVTLNGGKYRHTSGLRELFYVGPKWMTTHYHPTEKTYGEWYNYTLGDIANLGRREWLRMTNVGPFVADLIERAIDAAAAGESICLGPHSKGRQSYIPKCERD